MPESTKLWSKAANKAFSITKIIINSAKKVHDTIFIYRTK